MVENTPIVNAVDVYIDSKKVNEKLLELSMATGYSCIQRNGQRYYGPPPNWNGPPPPRGSEVFIGRLPRDCFEDEVVPFCTKIAPIYEMRMMMNFTGFNRGFAFATFFSPEDAWRAVAKLHETEIRPGQKVGVFKSIDNCRLYIGGIPLDKNKEEAWDEIIKFCSTVKDIIMYPNPKDRKLNRGFLFIEFDCHRSAAMAKRMLTPGATKFWGREVIVDWAVPEPDVDPNIMSTITKLFLRNLTPAFNSECIQQLLQEMVKLPGSSVQRVYVNGHYGFVHFDSRSSAQQAKDKLSKVILGGEALEVHWARPKCFKKSVNTNCKSMPPRYRYQEINSSSSVDHSVESSPISAPRLPMPAAPIHPQLMSPLVTPPLAPPTMPPLPQSVHHAQNQFDHEDVNNNYSNCNYNNNYKCMEEVRQPYGYSVPHVLMYTHNPFSYFAQ